jgi:uncharacterized protein YbaP (TraB family)
MNRIILLAAFFISNISFGQKTYLWKVSSKNSDKISYLFGTYHAVGDMFFKKYPVLEKALLSCDQVVTETEIKRDSVLLLFKDRVSTDDLRKTLDEKKYQQVKEILKDISVDLGKLTPAEVVGGLQNRFDMLNCDIFMSRGTYFLDQYVQVLADSNNKSNYYLETLVEQEDYKEKADGPQMTWPMAKIYINMLLKQYAKYQRSGKSTCPAIADDYVNFRINYQLDKSCFKVNERSQKLLIGRNAKWMEVLPGLMAQKNVFIAVGLNHLNFECGLITQLRALGYTVEPVEM